ncbi:MAG TPA: hypothetical protein VNJ11_17115 [Bryobacteraceae bacterium]|nr:hypothetical protein [Bryobacteraceae bacterium]
MAVREPRNRLVIFRLSETEYERLLAACRRDAARSLSDYVRDAVIGCAASPRGGETAQAALKRLAGRIRQLEAQVGRLVARLEQVR